MEHRALAFRREHLLFEKKYLLKEERTGKATFSKRNAEKSTYPTQLTNSRRLPFKRTNTKSLTKIFLSWIHGNHSHSEPETFRVNPTYISKKQTEF